MSAGNGTQRRRVLVVGLDAATFDLVLPWAESGALPTVARLLREGAHAPLRSTLPALTPPGWTSAAYTAEPHPVTTPHPSRHAVWRSACGSILMQLASFTTVASENVPRAHISPRSVPPA